MNTIFIIGNNPELSIALQSYLLQKNIKWKYSTCTIDHSNCEVLLVQDCVMVLYHEHYLQYLQYIKPVMNYYNIKHIIDLRSG